MDTADGLNTDQPSKPGMLVAVGTTVLVGLSVGGGDGVCVRVVGRVGVAGCAGAAHEESTIIAEIIKPILRR